MRRPPGRVEQTVAGWGDATHAPIPRPMKRRPRRALGFISFRRMQPRAVPSNVTECIPETGGTMAVHGVKKSHEAVRDPPLRGGRPSQRVPKYRIPEGEWDPRHAHELIVDELMVEGNSRLNLVTFTQTRPEPEVRLLMAETCDKNPIDKDESTRRRPRSSSAA